MLSVLGDHGNWTCATQSHAEVMHGMLSKKVANKTINKTKPDLGMQQFRNGMGLSMCSRIYLVSMPFREACADHPLILV